MCENVRRAGLSLETLYGEGPLVSRFAYEPSRGPQAERVKLKLGRVQRDDRTQNAQCPFRDIARGGEPGRFEPSELTEPLIADPRNDAHAILSQLTSTFSLLHNGIVELLEKSTLYADQSPAERALSLFAEARQYSTQALRAVVRNDLLQRLLDPRIYNAYEAGVRLADAPPAKRSWSVPLEFSQGAIRFGHSLVRDEYRINDGATNDLIENLTKTSLADPRNMPLNESWVVQWSHFFTIGNSKPNLAKRVGPHYSSGLVSEQIFPAIDAGGRVGLAYRDLLSSAFSNLWSAPSLIEEIRRRRPDFVGNWRTLDDHAWRASELASWLHQNRAFGGLDAADIATISRDPPLSFYVQWEAMREAGGLHLGPLASIIVAETVYGALGQPCGDPSDGAVAAALPRGSQARGLLDQLARVRTMPDLIVFVRDACGLAHSIPAFV